MKRTVYNTAIITPLLRAMAWLGLKLSGWKIVGEMPGLSRYVLIAAPHTSNWDFPIMLAASLCRRTSVSWFGKDSLFKGAYGPISRWLSGIAIDRSKSNDVVGQIVERYGTEEQLVILICPEGTRGAVGAWKTGFYHIAHQAGVPVVLAYADYPTKTVGFGPSFDTTGDLATDLAEIQAFYADFQGKHGPSLHRD